MSFHEIIVHDVLPEHLEYEDESDEEKYKITVNNNIFNGGVYKLQENL